MCPESVEQQAKSTSMKRQVLICVIFLALGLFHVSESVATNGNSMDSMQDAKINEIQSRIEKQEDLIREQNRRINELSSQNVSGVPGRLLALTLVNTLMNTIALCFFVSKSRKGNKDKKSKKEESGPKNDDTVPIIDEPTKVSKGTHSSSNNVPAGKPAQSETGREEGNSRNVGVMRRKNDPSGNMPGERAGERRKAKQHRFANFMIDDGEISTLERTISNDSSDKLFAIDYEEGSTFATYTINQGCKAAILSDIQTFQNYVKKFNVTGNPTDIVVKKVGHLNKVGNRWIVKDRLEVEFK